MVAEYFSRSTDHKREIHFIIQTPQVDQEVLPDMTLKSVISDAFSYIDDQAGERDVLITIKSVDEKSDKVLYEIVNEKGHRTHEVAFRHFSNETLQDIGERHIVSTDEILKEDGIKSLLDRFSIKENRPKGFLGLSKMVLSNFFEKILTSFQFVDKLWDAITHRSAKKLKWDINLLNEICGVTPVDGMSMYQALKYMSAMLVRERDETTDPALSLRISDAAKLAGRIEELRNSFSGGGFKKIVSDVQHSIENLNQNKLFVPVGFTKEGKLSEMLIEVSKDSRTGAYTLAFISGSDEMRTLFDREVGINNGAQAIRREITSVKKEDLLAVIPLFIELETSPECFNKVDATPWREIFLQNMKLHGSWVAVSQTEEKYRGGMSPGHLSETITYAKGEKKVAEEGDRFELALRLRIFLDVCKDNEKGFKNHAFRTQVRTTALHLASLIEEEKKIVGALFVQGQEMTKIYGELKTLIDTLETTMPELVDLRKKVLPLLDGPVEIDPSLTTPPLIKTTVEPNVFPDIDPILEPLDENDPSISITNWSLRCRTLIEEGRTEQAALEAKLMVRMLPKPSDRFWSGLDKNAALEVMEKLSTLSEALARSCYGKEQPSLNDISSVVALNCYGYGLSKIVFPGKDILKIFAINAQKAMNELLESRLPMQDRTWLEGIKGTFDPGTVDYYSPENQEWIDRCESIPPKMQALFNLSQMTNVALGNYGKVSTGLPAGVLNFTFAYGRVGIEGVENWESAFNWESKVPFSLRAPHYAQTLSKEVENRYLSEYCCLGCIRDNCPNYNRVDKKDHRFHPLYMLHNNVDIFCEGLVNEGKLYRDEVSDLMYTQQTNQNANMLWKNVHQSQHGFDYATGFNGDDRHAQMMNTAALFFDKPHFFKQPELRWHFEMKLFANHAFEELMKSAELNENKPFLIKVLKNITKEINVSYISGNKEVTAYLLSVADRIVEMVDASSLDVKDKQELISLVSVQADEVLLKMVKELVGKHDTRANEQQCVLLPIFLDRYFKKFCKDCKHPDFQKNEVLEVIVASLARVESIESDKDKIDPEIRDRYHTLMQWLHPKIKEIMLNETKKGEFVNKILMILNPEVAALRLEWEPTDYPTVLALDGQGEFYQFDLSTGELTFGKSRLEGLPAEITRDVNLKRFFGEAVNDSWQRFTVPKGFDSAPISAFSHKEFPDYRVVIRKGERGAETKVIIERFIEGSKGKKQWFTYTRFNEQDRLFSGKQLSSSPDIPLRAAIAIGDRTCWLDPKEQQILVFDNDNKELYAKVHLKKVKSGTEEEPVVQTVIQDVHLIEEDVHLLDPKESDLESFTAIEDAGFVQVTGRKGKPASVSYPRYELANKGLPVSYHLSKAGITTPAFPGFQLAPVGIRPGSQDPALGVLPLPRVFDGFQLLKKDGFEKVLIPLRGFEEIYSVRGERLPLTKTVFPNTFSKCPIYEFSIDNETNRLIAQTGDAYAYLAYLNMAHKDYASASFYLEKAKTCSGYADNYQTITEWMQKWQDDSPNGIALKLKFELFQEKVLEDRRLRQIASGKFNAVESIDFNKTNRLSSIAELYKKYSVLTVAGSEGEVGVDPTLALSLDESFYITEKIRELLKEHGDQAVETGEPKPIRAGQIRMQTYAQGKGLDAYDLNKAALLIWIYAGNSRYQTPLALQDPRWLLQNFRDTFNQILKFDVNSVEFKELHNRLRMVSERSQGNLSEEEYQVVQFAQSYLLKLVTIKLDDPNTAATLKQVIGAEKLPRISGAVFTSSRQNQFIRMAETQNYMDKFCLSVKRRATAKAEEMSKIDAEDGNDPLDMRSIGKRALKFANKFSGNDKAFKAAFKPFLLREIYGNSGAQSIQDLSNVFNILDTVKIKQPLQRLQAKPAAATGKQETYRDRYANLLMTSSMHELQNEISILEKKIDSRAVSQQARSTTINSDKLLPVLGDEKVKACMGRFSVDSQKASKINEFLFDQLKSSSEPAFVRVAEENRADMHAYVEDRNQVTIKKDEIVELQDFFENELRETSAQEAELKKNLLQYVELFKTPAGIMAMRRLVGQGVKPSLEYLIAIWRNGDISKEWKDHPFRKLGMKEMNPALLKQLDADITSYLELNTKRGHLKRLVSLGESYLQSCGDQGFGDAQLASELYEAIGVKRQFTTRDNTEFRDFLFLEYSQGIILRGQQVETLRDMINDPNAVRQLIMGGGKSKVLLPMLAKRKANGKNLVMLMLPEELYETNCRDLDNTNRQLFGQEMYRFNFSRSSDMGKEGLTEVYKKLLKTVNDQGFVMTTKRSMLSFRNAYLDLLYKLQAIPEGDPANESNRQEVIGRLRAMSKIMKLFNEKTDVIADEVDACLDVRKEVNFSLGKSERVDQIKVDLGSELMQMILSAKEGDPLHELGVALHHNTQAAFSPDKREELLKTMSREFYDKNKKLFSGIEKESFVAYVLDEPQGEGVEGQIFKLKETNNPVFKRITTFKGLINRGLGTTLGRVGNVNYGRDPVTEMWTIPYMASNAPHIGSEFDDDLERICFTYQDYMQNGVSYKQVYQIIARLFNDAQAEIRSKEHRPGQFFDINDTKAAVEFNNFLKSTGLDKKLGSAISLATVATPKRIEALVSVINESPVGKVSFCQRYVLANMEQYMAQINAISADLVEMVHHFAGFTGTPWNLHTYHDKINALKSAGVDGKTWALMLGRNIQIHAFDFDAENPIESLISQLDVVGHYQAVIDTGAYLRGTDNRDFIDGCFKSAEKQGKAMEGGIYFDDSGRIVKKREIDEKPLPIEIAPETDKMQTITLYDQAHTVGADIKQGKKAKAVVTIGENTFIRDLFQAVWRLRQLHQDQRVGLAVSNEIKERILGGEKRELTTEDILKFCLVNEASREGDDNFKAEREKINGFARRAVIPKVAEIIVQGASDQEIIKMSKGLASESADLFIKQRPGEDAYDQYGKMKIKKAPDGLFDALKVKAEKKCLQVSDSLKDVNTSAAHYFIDRATVVAKRQNPPKDWCPKEVDSTTSGSGEVEQEAQAEVEQELELMIETETEQQVQVQVETLIPKVETGAAGHGDVLPLQMETLLSVVNTGVCADLMWPHGDRFGDIVVGDNMMPVKGLIRQLSNAVPYFGENVFLTAVFERNLPAEKGIVAPQAVFYSNRKPVKNILIVKENDRWTLLIPTIHEAHTCCRGFIKEAKDNTQAAEVTLSPNGPMVVYKTGADRTDALPFTDEKDRKEFYKLYVQAKLFNGEIEFNTQEEKNALKEWLIAKGPQQFKTYFEQNILAAKPRRFADAYFKSSLFKIMKELIPDEKVAEMVA